MSIEKSSGNVYADLGFPDAEAMLVKARLAFKISEIIQHRHLTQQEAAKILGMPQPKLSNLLRGQFSGISEAKMIECLNHLGRNVEIVIKKASHSALGKTKVVFEGTRKSTSATGRYVKRNSETGAFVQVKGAIASKKSSHKKVARKAS